MSLKANTRKRLMGIILVLFIGLASLSTPFQSFASFPDELRLFSGEGKKLQLALPVQAQVTVQDPDVVSVNGHSQHSFQLKLSEPISLQSVHTGQTEMQLKLFGKIPLKKVKVHVLPDLKVIPGGQTIGVKIKSDGILVVGHHRVQLDGKKQASPGEQANIKVGDLIVALNGKKLNGVSDVAAIVEQAGKNGKAIEVQYERNGKELKTNIRPLYDSTDQSYRLGLYIRDSAAGVGTLTFYAPDQKVYGALGHIITDMDTMTPIKVGSGEVVYSNVTSISKSENGDPGEKRAHFYHESKVLGNIRKNTQFGIFGDMQANPDYGLLKEALPVALAEEVKPGPAEILTVVGGQQVERFKIEIVHVSKQSYPATKGMVIKITDPRLLQKTGGIVQGMSGSPIIQNGKIIGAVTHVFVNDPASGYGCFIEWMLQDAGIHLKPRKQQAS